MMKIGIMLLMMCTGLTGDDQRTHGDASTESMAMIIGPSDQRRCRRKNHNISRKITSHGDGRRDRHLHEHLHPEGVLGDRASR